MTQPNDLRDPELEGYLRATFSTDAGQAPLPHDLATRAVRRGRAQRRRTATATAAASVVALVVGVAVVQQRGPSTTSTPPAENSPAPVEGPESVLMLRGVEVPVPAGMLKPGSVRCGSAVADAAYVRDYGLPVRACAMSVKNANELTEVVLQPESMVPPEDRVPGRTLLSDGRTRIASAMPQGGVWLAVTSPDPQRAQSLFDGARVVAVTNGCQIRATFPGAEGAPYNWGVGSRFAVDKDATTGQVCGYRDGWVTGAAVLTEAQVRDLNELIEQAHITSFATVDCAISKDATNSGWSISLGNADFWVNAGAPCTPLVDSAGRTSFTSTELSSTLWSLAAGPGSFDSGNPGTPK